MTKVLFLATDFSDPTNFGHGSIDPEHVLKVFSQHSHINTRNACLQALKLGMGSTGFSNLVKTQEVYVLFESAIRSLLEFKPSPHVGFTAGQHQEKWHCDAVETLVDAWLVVACRDLRDRNALSRPLQVLFDLAKKEEVVFSRTKSLKHVLYYSWEWVVCEAGPVPKRSLHDLSGLQDFLFSYIRHLYLDLQEKDMTEDSWEPVKKILEFIASHGYFKKKLMSEISELREILWGLRATVKGDALKRMRLHCLYEQALSICDYLLQVVRIRPELQKD